MNANSRGPATHVENDAEFAILIDTLSIDPSGPAGRLFHDNS